MESDAPRNVQPLVIESGDVETIEADDDAPVQLSDVDIAVPEHSHVGESASNGLAERAVQMFENQFLTLKHALELRLKSPIDIRHPCITWLVHHVGYVLSR